MTEFKGYSDCLKNIYTAQNDANTDNVAPPYISNGLTYYDTTDNMLHMTGTLTASTVATLADAQTLTNKAIQTSTLQDSSTYIVDNTDATKRVNFECSGITTGQTRTLTMPNVSGTLSVSPSISTISTGTTLYAVGFFKVSCPSTEYSIYLPTAVGINGQTIKFLRTDNAPSKKITLDGFNAEIIGGFSSVGLWTQNEMWTLTSDGANWIIENHYAKTDWVNDTGFGLEIGATTTAPTKSSGTKTDECRWRRDGKMMHVERFYTQSTFTGASAGDGDYLFRLPLSDVYTGDYQEMYTALEGYTQWEARGQVIGNCSVTNNPNSMLGIVIPYSGIYVRLFISNASFNSAVCSAFLGLNTSSLSYSFIYSACISQWNV